MQEVLPCLLRVLCRPLRAVAPNIFTAAERAVMAELVSLLLTHGLTFDMEADGSSEPLTLRPEVHRLCSFPVSASCFRTPQIISLSACIAGGRAGTLARHSSASSVIVVLCRAAWVGLIVLTATYIVSKARVSLGLTVDWYLVVQSFAVPQRTLPAAVRQLVVHATQMEGLRRKDQVAHPHKETAYVSKTDV